MASSRMFGRFVFERSEEEQVRSNVKSRISSGERCPTAHSPTIHIQLGVRFSLQCATLAPLALGDPRIMAQVPENPIRLSTPLRRSRNCRSQARQAVT